MFTKAVDIKVFSERYFIIFININLNDAPIAPPEATNNKEYNLIKLEVVLLNHLKAFSL